MRIMSIMLNGVFVSARPPRPFQQSPASLSAFTEPFRSQPLSNPYEPKLLGVNSPIAD